MITAMTEILNATVVALTLLAGLAGLAGLAALIGYARHDMFTTLRCPHVGLDETERPHQIIF